MSKLEDLIAKKKTVVSVLDLSRNVVQHKDDFKRLMEKVPDYKMRPVKVRMEEIKIKDKDFHFKMPKKEMRKLIKCNGTYSPLYYYADPIPGEMKDIILMELCVVPIDWKMLTISGPKLKQEEEFFSRMVEMGKLQVKTELRDRRENMFNNCVQKMKNKSGAVETRLDVCSECAEEICQGRACMDFSYDLFVRIEAKQPKLIAISKNSKKNASIVKKKVNASQRK